jgi:hypothetical protein
MTGKNLPVSVRKRNKRKSTKNPRKMLMPKRLYLGNKMPLPLLKRPPKNSLSIFIMISKMKRRKSVYLKTLNLLTNINLEKIYCQWIL